MNTLFTGQITIYGQEEDDELKFPLPEEDPYSHNLSEGDSGLHLRQPSNYEKEVEYDPETNQYIIKESIGGVQHRPTKSLSIDEYKDQRFQQSMQKYWHEQARDDDGKSQSFIPSLNLGGKAFNTIFGSNTVNITPQGSAELIFSINHNRTDNPALQEKLRTTTTFDFQENIQMNVQGSIGDKVQVGITYDTEATFDFENKTNIGYSGDEDEIIQKIEAGNVSLPLTGSLITGSQNLFGIKTELKFGHLTMTSVFSQQKGKTKVIEVEGGAEKQRFDIEVDDYDKNKHFFLGHFFKDRYDTALSTLPIISSGVNISKIEVWVTNKNNNFETSRDIIGFVDLAETGHGEEYIYNKDITTAAGVKDINPYNKANTLYQNLVSRSPEIRQSNTIINALNSLPFDLEQGVDYEKIESARKLSQNEYTINRQLGFISLNSSLNTDEVLAVAFEYNYKGKTYQVGELSSDVGEGAIMLKLIKGTNLTPRFPSWDLMMKNVYAIGAYQVEREDFELNILYRNDETGTSLNYIPEGGSHIKNKNLLQVMNLDRLNSQGDRGRDGFFDFVPGVTVLPSTGRIIFPIREPFGEHLRKKIGNDQDLIDKYVFSELYDSTQTKAEQIASKNKYELTGSYKSASGSEIPLNAMNVPKGSVNVTAGGIQLQENVDYTVDYTLGRVKILNEGLLESGTPIQISLESNSLYNMQTKTLIGTHLDYKVSDNFMLGGTILNLTERPLTKKVNIGDEPISNTIWGINGRYSTESQFLTKMVDQIPFIDTKEASRVSVNAEFAHLIPGHSRAIDKEGNSYLDDFEGSESSIDVKSYSTWVLSSTPQRNLKFPSGDFNNNHRYGYNRAKFAWYVIDPLFLRNNSLTPDHIKDNSDLQSSHLVREVYEKELFPERQPPSGVPTNIPVLNLAFYPSERGPYNYDYLDINNDGSLQQPEKRWGGIMREIPTSDFEDANIEFIDFWLMDPYVEDSIMGINNRSREAKLYFHLGEISEDILRDSRKNFENGLPPLDQEEGTDTTVWGRIPNIQSKVNAFDTDVEAREYQDVGLDGLNDEFERSFFSDYLSEVETRYGSASDAYQQALTDPSSDNFTYYRSSEYDQQEADILRRYKDYNGQEGNAPSSEQSNEDYSTAAKTVPDVEDINNDNTLNESEAYYEYKISMAPEDFEVGKNYIMDKVPYNAKFENGQRSTVNWYHFRIPIKEFENRYGPIQDFNSIRFMRMIMSGFENPVYMRFATLDLVRGEWRKYTEPFVSAGEDITIPEPADANFNIAAVNIEENANKDPINYILPPDIDRVVDPASPQLRELNEQSMSLKVSNLPDGESRAAYKNINIDIREYKRLEMYVHAEATNECPLEDDELSYFVRIGSDYMDHYYEFEVPLKLTPHGNYNNDSEEDRRRVWPKENDMLLRLDRLIDLKLERNRQMDDPNSPITYRTIYEKRDENGIMRIRGNPTLSEVRTIMIGVRNSKDSDGQGLPLCGEVWVNELRLTHFREEGGWAANARVTTQLADFANISLAGSTSKPGFGSIEKKTNERSKEDVYQYDISSNFSLGKFFPDESGVRIPMFLGYSRTMINPLYNPLDEDVLFKDAFDNMENQEDKEKLKRMVQDLTVRKSINFQNVGISMPESDPSPFNPSNLSLNYSFREIYQSNVQLDHDLMKEHQGGLVYNYTIRPKPVQPFRNSFRKPAFRLIRDFNFNYLPSMIGFSTSMRRRYNERTLRNIQFPDMPLDTTYQKNFIWLRDYKFKYDLTRSIQMDFTANATSRIDEPYGAPQHYNQSQKDTIREAILSGGRPTQYNHKLNVRYNTPINKIPLLNWTTLSINYSTDYFWNAGPDPNGPYQPNATSPNWTGNDISNSNTITYSSNLSMRNLYNKVGFLRDINNEFNGRGRQKEEKETVEYTEDGIELERDKSTTIRHNLNTEDIEVWVTSTGGEEIDVELEKASKNRIKITPSSNYRNVNVRIEGEAVKKPNLLVLAGKYIARLAMSVQRISINYSESNGTSLSGFDPQSRFAGMDSRNNWAPGVPFALGLQDRGFIWDAYRKGWLVDNNIVSTPVMYNYKESLRLRSNIEPFNGFRIDLNANRTYSETVNQYFYPIGDYVVPNQIENNLSGNFSMTTISIGSAFEKIDPESNYSSAYFSRFENYRRIISRRWYHETSDRFPNYEQSISDSLYNVQNNYAAGFGSSSPQVLIPAFLAAYTGKDPKKVSLDPMPSAWSMLPNWSIRYNNLTKIKWLGDRFRTININHAYSSTYTLGGFTTDPDFEKQRLNFNLDGNILDRYDMASVTIQESFRPLLGIDVTLKNNLSARFQYRKSRSLNLSFSNSRITEVHMEEIVIGTGYRFDDFSLIISNRGGQNALEGDLNLNGDISFKDNKTILRDLDANLPGEPSSGKNIVTIGLSADYAIGGRFNVRLFYDKIINNPLISTSFPTRNTNFGFSVRFTLAQ